MTATVMLTPGVSVSICEDAAKHGLPAIGPKGQPTRVGLMQKDPERPFHWYDPMNDETYRLHPRFPGEPDYEPMVIPGQVVMPPFQPGHGPSPSSRKEYLLPMPDGKEVSCPDKETWKALFQAVYGDAQAPAAVVDQLLTVAEVDAPPTKEEIHEHEARLEQQEMAESGEVIEKVAPIISELSAKLEAAQSKAFSTRSRK